jgi:hypothetical protein
VPSFSQNSYFFNFFSSILVSNQSCLCFTFEMVHLMFSSAVPYCNKVKNILKQNSLKQRFSLKIVRSLQFNFLSNFFLST